MSTYLEIDVEQLQAGGAAGTEVEAPAEVLNELSIDREAAPVELHRAWAPPLGVKPVRAPPLVRREAAVVGVHGQADLADRVLLLTQILRHLMCDCDPRIKQFLRHLLCECVPS